MWSLGEDAPVVFLLRLAVDVEVQIVLHPGTAKVKWLTDQSGLDGIDGGLAVGGQTI
jgi:hypothetical protein